ncbi:unnamed protein product, partial [Symbiodinium pilosum]
MTNCDEMAWKAYVLHSSKSTRQFKSGFTKSIVRKRAMVLFVLSDPRLPFGQLRMRSAFDSSNPWLRSAYAALGQGNRVTCLYVGAGSSARSEALLAAEEASLPTVLCNAATAIEVWLSEADLGLVMRFVNRPEVYEMPPGWPYTHQVLENGQTDALPEGE